MTTYNTGVTASANSATSCNITIPSGVLTNDVMLLSVSVFTETSTAPTVSFSGGGGTWTLIPVTTGANPTLSTAGSSIWSYTYAYYRVATAGDPGATLTVSETGSGAGSTWFALDLESYTGASTSSPIDVAGSASNTDNNNTVTCPSMTTGVAGDWGVYLYGGAPGVGISISGPSTNRHSIVSSAGVGAAINDSNGSVGGPGSTVGGGTFTATGASTAWMSAFTIGLAPASTGGPSGMVQPGATVRVPRRRPARAVVAGSKPFPGYVAVPAPKQKPPVPQRRPARAVVAGSKPFPGYVAVPAPRQQPGPAPRRKPSRAVVQFTPVAGSNASPAAAPSGTVPVLTASPVNTIVRRTSRLSRF